MKIEVECTVRLTVDLENVKSFDEISEPKMSIKKSNDLIKLAILDEYEFETEEIFEVTPVSEVKTL